MAIVVTPPAAVGPGYLVYFTGLTGPVPVDDFVSVAVRQLVTDNFLISGNVLCRGFTAGYVTLGLGDLGPIAAGVDKYVAPAAAVRVEWAQRHASGTVVASGVILTSVWDPTGAAYALLGFLSGLGLHSVDDVYRAVVRSFPVN